MKRNHRTHLNDLLNVVLVLALFLILFTYSGGGAQARTAESIASDARVSDVSAFAAVSPTKTTGPTRTPTSTQGVVATVAISPTATLSATPTSPITPTVAATPTDTATPMASATNTLGPTSTPKATDTPTFSPTAVPPSDTDTPTATPIATETQTAVPSATETETATAAPIATETQTAVASATETETATAAPTSTETPTSSSTGTPTATITLTATSIATSSPTPTAMPSVDQAVIDPTQGGLLNSDDGNVSVEFPRGAVSTPLVVKFARPTSDVGQGDKRHQLVVNQFSLDAFDLANPTNEIRNFELPVKITVRYDPGLLRGWNESDLQLVYWDDAAKRWLPVESAVDVTTHQVVAQTPHFTNYGLTSAPDVQSYLPNLEGFQTDLFTGAAGFSYPLEVPPGRGGLTPRLSLAYSSGSVDMLNSSEQVSYVGAGWGLDTGYVARDKRNTYDGSDDVFSIILNGAGYDLVLGADGKYHTSKEQYWAITKTGDSWKVITNDGTTYYFGSVANSRANEWRKDGYGHFASDTYTWWLDKVVDTHGNEIDYTYMHETESRLGSCQTDGTPYDSAIYPQTITYNTGLTQISFSYTARDDYGLNYPALQCGPAPYQRSKLDHIDVSTSNGTALQLVRKYQFTYDYSTFPGVYSDHGDGTGKYGRLTLKQITRYGKDGTSSLPPYAFTYQNNRLQVGANGIGGQVTFSYDSADAGALHDKYDQDYTQWISGQESYAFWKGHNGAVGILNESMGKKSLVFSPNSTSSYLSWAVDPFTPGATYVLTNTVSPASAGCSAGCGFPMQIQLRLWNGSSEQNLTNWINLTPGSAQTVVTTLSIPDAAKAPEFRLYAKPAGSPYGIGVEHTLLQPRSTRHRVVTKATDDGMGNTSPYTYSYAGIALNDKAHSDAAKTMHPRHEPGSEFRGHTQVTVTDPLGNTSESDFAQDDLYVGRVTQTIQSDNASNKYIKATNVYSYTNYAVADPDHPVTGDRIDFIKLTETDRYTYDGANGVQPKHQKSTYQYDAFGNVSETDDYDDAGALYRKTMREFYGDAAGAHILNKVGRSYATDASGAILSETRYTYDANTGYNQAPTKGELKQILVTANGTTFFGLITFIYDSYGNMHTATDALNHATTIDYDPVYHLFPTTVTNAKQQATTSTYDYVLGRLLSTTDPNTATTSKTYDVFGRTLTITAPLEQGYAATAQYDYTLGSTGNPSRVHVKVRRDPGGSNSPDYQEGWWFFDGEGRMIQRQAQGLSGQIIVANTGYNSLGQVWRTSNPYYVTATGGVYRTPDWSQPYAQQLYDAIGRTIKTINPDTTFQTIQYDHWTTTVTDANGHYKKSTGDAFGRIIQVQEFKQGQLYATTTYGYDPLNRLTDTWDNANHNIHLTYDKLGRKTALSDPDMGNWSYTYDNAGNLKQQTDALSHSVCFDYDQLNRLTQKRASTSTNCDPGSPNLAYTVNYGFDDATGGNAGIGHRTSLSDPSGSYSWFYDKQGRVTRAGYAITGAPQAYTTTLTYDAMDRPRSTTYPDGEVVSMNYNAQGLLDTLGTYVTQSNYNAAGELTFLKLGNNDTTTYTYNSQNLRLTDLVTQNGGGTTLQNLHYNYDNVGNIQQIVDGVRGETSNYQYDDLNRLLSAAVSNGPNPYTQGWAYDPLGNITQRTDNGTPTNYTYDTNNKPHAVRQAGTQTYQYDANGNMTNRAGDTLHYDVENRLTQVVTGGGVTTDYVYNGDGVRVKKVANGISTFYIGGSYVVSVNGQVTTASKYYYFGSVRVAVKFGGTLYYLHTDHLGSTSVATDTNGNPISKQTYFGFGAVRTSEGTSPTDYGFTGQRYDASSALMYYGARYYDPVLRRFTQADPVVADAWNPQALNRYGYVYNNPVRYSDPTGYRVEEGCGCYIPPDPAPLPARYEDPSKYGEPPEPEVPPLPAEECHSRACKDDVGTGPSQPTVTPTPTATPQPCWDGTFSANCRPKTTQPALVFDPSCMCAASRNVSIDLLQLFSEFRVSFLAPVALRPSVD